MPVQEFAPAAADALRLDDIQGDIVVGLQKNAENFVFFRIVDAAALKAKLRTQDILQHVTSAKLAADREAELAVRKPGDPPLLLLGFNIGFTVHGLRKLRPGDALAGLDPSFLAGAPARAEALNDDLARYLPPFAGDDIDGVLLVTGPTRATTRNHSNGLLNALGASIHVVYSEMGQTRPKPFRGHEHFGYLDGVSQPGLRGFTAQQGSDPEQGLPGQDLLWPGEFIFGYPTQIDPLAVGHVAKKEDRGPVSAPPAAWMLDGAYMVFRRLEQNVLAFDAFLQAEARAPETPDLLGSKLVGRWKSGAPIELTSAVDDPALGADPLRNNDFEFQAGDAAQLVCPFAGHIRKSYPRDDLNDAPGVPLLVGESGEASVQTHRIRRAGIPFGAELFQDEYQGNEEAIGHEASRGLMFVCYQTSIVDQFEFVQSSWCNSPGFVFGKQRANGTSLDPGHDIIIGQSGGVRTIEMANGRVLSGVAPFVTATGAGYFFMPSLPALRAGLGA